MAREVVQQTKAKAAAATKKTGAKGAIMKKAPATKAPAKKTPAKKTPAKKAQPEDTDASTDESAENDDDIAVLADKNGPTKPAAGHADPEAMDTDSDDESIVLLDPPTHVPNRNEYAVFSDGEGYSSSSASDSEPDGESQAEPSRLAMRSKKGSTDSITSPVKDNATRVFKSRTEQEREQHYRSKKQKRFNAMVRAMLGGKPVFQDPPRAKLVRCEGGSIPQGYTINSNGAIVERVSARQKAKLYDFSKAVHLKKPEVTQEQMLKERINEVKGFLNSGAVHKNSLDNARAVIKAYEEQGGSLAPFDGDEMDKKSDMTFWYKGKQIPALKAMTMKTDNEVWMEPRSLHEIRFASLSMGVSPGIPTHMPQLNMGPNLIGMTVRGGSPVDILNGLRPGTDDIEDATFVAGKSDIDFDRSVIRWTGNATEKAPVISVALRYPPSMALRVQNQNQPQDALANSAVAFPSAVIAEFTMDTGATDTLLSQQVVDQLDARQTYYGTTRSCTCKGYQAGARQPNMLRFVQYCITYKGVAVTEWEQFTAIIPPQAKKGLVQTGYDYENLAGWSIFGRLHWLVAKGANDPPEMHSFKNWRCIQEQVNGGYINYS